MSIHVLCTGALTADPQRRQGQKAAFVTATLRVADSGGGTFVSVIAFGEMADQLAELCQGAAVSVSGAAKLTSWIGRDGEEKRGISITATQLIALAPQKKIGSRAPLRRAPYKPRSGPPKGAPLPSDSLDDLWPEDGP